LLTNVATIDISMYMYSLFGDSENRENNYLKIRDLLSIALFKEQVMLFIIMVASFTYNLIKLVLGPMEIFFII
jgi:hypothetical protein